MRELAQTFVERAEPGVDVVEAPAHALPEVVGDDRGDLRRRLPQLLGQRHDLLQRPVVEVVAEAQEAPLAGSHEVVLTLHSPVEERSTLEQRRERGRSLVEVLVEMLRLGAASAGDDRGVRAIPPLDDADVHLGRAGGDSVERGLCHLTQATAARCLAVRDEAGGGAHSVEDPERAGRGGCELDEESECELRGADRRKLRELLARERAPEDREGRSFGWQPELVRRGGDHDPCIPRLEAVLDRDGDNRVAEEVQRSTLAPAVGQPPRPHLARPEGGTQVRWQVRGCARPRLSGADRRRTGDQLRGQRGTDRRDVPPVRRSIHSFHSCIVRSMNVLNNDPHGPTVDHLPERLWNGRSRCCGKGSGQKRCPFAARNEAGCGSPPPRAR